jgi:hypothetical protein
MKRAFLAASVLFAAITVIGAAHASPGTLVVDKDKVQCPKADFTSIQAAVTAAQPGDKIKVCPDLYNEDVTVNKTLTLQATSKPDVDSCSTPAPADPTQNAIVTGVTSSFTLLANDITLDGFVVQGNSTVGIRTSDAFSGYLIRENVVQSNDFSGINFLSSGARESRVTHNCLRFNTFDGLASEVSAEGANLDNARVDHNFAIDNAVGIDPSGAGARVNVVLEHNESLGNTIGYAISNSTASAIVHNSSEGDFFGIDVAGANVGLDVVTTPSSRGRATGSSSPSSGPSQSSPRLRATSTSATTSSKTGGGSGSESHRFRSSTRRSRTTRRSTMLRTGFGSDAGTPETKWPTTSRIGTAATAFGCSPAPRATHSRTTACSTTSSSTPATTTVRSTRGSITTA